MDPERSKLTNVRGASMVEYAMLLFAVLIVAAAAIKTIGNKVAMAGDLAGFHLRAGDLK